MVAASCFQAILLARSEDEEIVNSYKLMLRVVQNIQVSARKQKLKRNQIFQDTNDPKHTSKSTKELLNQMMISVLETLSKSPVLNSTKCLCGNLKRHKNYFLKLCHANGQD